MFRTVSEAEAFLCRNVPQARQKGDWFEVFALAYPARIRGFDTPEPVMIRYASRNLNTTIALMSSERFLPGECRPGEGVLTTIRMGKATAEMWRQRNSDYQAVLCWENGGVSLRAHVVLQGESLADVLPQMLPMLESVE